MNTSVIDVRGIALKQGNNFQDKFMKIKELNNISKDNPEEVEFQSLRHRSIQVSKFKLTKN